MIVAYCVDVVQHFNYDNFVIHDKLHIVGSADVIDNGTLRICPVPEGKGLKSGNDHEDQMLVLTDL